ncbi:hypothetical protein ACET3X_000003 [Alternaria dauci]|uniref:Uncharacterized protein n=1 Tax=Alternaria dauci TaxID=48095 RepID=A0ABR3UT78_9PLEO
MKFSAITSALIVAGTSAAAVPAKLQARQESGSYSVPELGARKQQVTAAGANSFDLAIAMLETDKMDTKYAYGDNKVDDAANFGIFKQNWGVLRVCCDSFKGQPQSDWNNGALLNSDLEADVSCLKQCQSHYGLRTWLAGHRWGETGFNNPNTEDINNYISGVEHIEQQLLTQPDAMTNDIRYYIYVVPV